MKKKYRLITAVLIITVLFSSCGKADTSISKEPTTNMDTSSGTDTDSYSKEKTQSKETKTPEETETPETEVSEEPEKQNGKVQVTINTKTGYSDDKHQINVIGFKPYKKLKSKLYKDKASKDKEFVVLFLEINNKLNDNDYINVNYLSAKIDGKKIKNTVLFNDPEGYKTIFQNIGRGETLRGFIAWEVPDNWKNLEIKYDGWEDTDNFSLNCILTPDNYFNPPQYN